MNQQQQMIEELLRQMPARRVLTPEVMPQGGGMPGMGGPVPRLPNMPIETTGGMVPMGAGAAGMGMGMIPGMVGAGMLYPSMIGGETGPEAAMGQIDRLSTQQGRVLPTPPYSNQESSAMIDSVLQQPTPRPKLELYNAMEPGTDPELEMASMDGGVMPGKGKRTSDTNPAKSAKPKKSAMQPEPMDDAAIDELIGPAQKRAAPAPSKVSPTDDSVLAEVVGGGLPTKKYRVKGAANDDEVESAASAADFVDRGRKKGIKTYSGKKKKRKYDLLEE